MDIKKAIAKEFEIIKKEVDLKKIPGACFAIITDKEIAYSCYGKKSLLPEEIDLSGDTLYDIASLSKVVSTSTMIAKLIEEDLLGFETKASSILEDFKYDDLTILDLLVHRSGYPADDKNYKLCKDANELWNFIINLPTTYEKGSRVEYSCFNYIILGKIIEKLKGNMEDYANEVLFEKLGTDNIMYNPSKKGRKGDCAPTEATEARGIICGEVHDGKAYILGGVSGNAGVFANIEAISLFVKMFLNNGTLNGIKILKKETMDLFKKAYTSGLNESRTMGGWYYADNNTSAGKNISKSCLYHTGFAGTSIYIDFERNCGLVLLTNAIHPNRDTNISQIRKEFHEQVLDIIDNN